MVPMFLNGGAMRGGPLHHLLGDAPLLAATTTAPKYRFYAVGGAFPALHPVAHGGVAAAGEVYELSLDLLRDRLLPGEPPELELGVIALADGAAAFAMVLRRPPVSFPRLVDISEIGDWRRYQKGNTVT